MKAEAAPVVIGATGGSGTRVFVRILRHAGWYMGRNLNSFGDALEFKDFLDRWINRYTESRLAGEEFPEDARLRADLEECVRRHRSGMADASNRWGWKSPRTMYLLPAIHALFPEMSYLHVVRDGRDIAFSRNQRQLGRHGDLVLGESWADKPRPVRSIGLWSRVNAMTAEYGEQHLGERYLRVRFEDLCEHPEETVDRIYGFLGVQPSSRKAAVCLKLLWDDLRRRPLKNVGRYLDQAMRVKSAGWGPADEVRKPPTIGRYRNQDPEVVAAVVEAGATALERFGYAGTK